MSGDRRVAVTGLGVVAPAGIGAEAFWAGLLGPGISDGRQSVEIDDWDPTPYFENPKHARRADRVEQFALAAAGEAFDQRRRLRRDRRRARPDSARSSPAASVACARSRSR